MTRLGWLVACIVFSVTCSLGPVAPSPSPVAMPQAIGEPQIVNIDSRINDLANPVFVFLEQGTYIVTPIGRAQGGAWDAWHAWSPRGSESSCQMPGGCPDPSPDLTGWLNSHAVTSGALVSATIAGRAVPQVVAPPRSTAVGGYLLKNGRSTHYHVIDNKAYPDAAAALSAAKASTFTTAAAGPVGFSIPDHPLTDNYGGMSLTVARAAR